MDDNLNINVASSTYVLEGFVNIDNSPFIKYFYILSLIRGLLPKKYQKVLEAYTKAKDKADLRVHDCRKPLPWPDEKVDHLLCSHFLEHIYPDEVALVLKDFFRLIKPEGTLHIIVPDIKALAKNYLEDSANGNQRAADEFIEKTLLSIPKQGSQKYRILEFIGAFGLNHRWMYDVESMSKKVQEAGFTLLRGNNTPSKSVRQNDGSVHIVARKT